MRNYTIIAIILIFTVLIFTSRSTFNDLRLFSNSMNNTIERRNVSESREPIKEEKAEEPKQEEHPVVEKETPKAPFVSDDYVKPVQKETPVTPKPVTQTQPVVKETPTVVQKPVYQEPPKNPYQKLIDDDNFPVNVYTPERHIKYVVFKPSTLRYGTLKNTSGYALNFPFGTEQERARNYFKISNVIDNSTLNNKCIYRQTAEYRTSRPTNYLYCDAAVVSLSELENVALILQNKGYEVYISDQIISNDGYFNGTQWVWRTYNGSYYD